MKLCGGGETRKLRLEKGVARIDARTVAFHELRRDGELEAIEIEGEIFRVRAMRAGDSAFVWCRGRAGELRRVPDRASVSPEPGGDLLSPMPGRVRRILAEPGRPVVRGDAILVLEAMKMEHAIRAPRDGFLTRILYREGDLVEAGAPLAEIG